MRVLLKGTGIVLYIGSGLLLWVAYFSFMGEWLGFIGRMIAIIICPGIVIFPAVVWIKTGVFPVGYFAVWAVGVFGGTFFCWLGSLGED
jgi:hypothetical protein